MADPKKIQRLKGKKKAPRSQGMPAPCRWGKSVMAFAASPAPGLGHRTGAAMDGPPWQDAPIKNLQYYKSN
ncbi:hypothetical protein [Allofranklinella schreckenbergeri]|uniref:hypothetical protein n=1 Tax=Allofranklinella schreckenbergeri TaxID=1076744 RepID=UPI001EEEF0D7|nr:hypothetical protein [Allofranklinella schreckenbergeri]